MATATTRPPQAERLHAQRAKTYDGIRKRLGVAQDRLMRQQTEVNRLTGELVAFAGEPFANNPGPPTAGPAGANAHQEPRVTEDDGDPD